MEELQPVASSTRGRIPTLDGWRAIAILCVIVYHTPELVNRTKLAHVGELGVSLFFSLSGLLIGLKLLGDERRHGRILAVPFFIGRLFRLLPALAVYLIVILILKQCGLIFVPGRSVLGAALGIANYWPGGLKDGWFLAHLWSLAIEWQFYLLLPPLMIAMGSRRRILFPVLAVLVTIWRFIVVRYELAGYYQAGDFVSPTWLTDTRLDGFVWGLIAAMWVERHGWPTAPRFRWIAWLVFPAVLAINFTVASVNVRLTTFAVAFPIMLITSVGQDRPGSLRSRVMNSVLLRWLGNISFSLYLYQELFLAPYALRSLGPMHDWPWSWIAALVAASLSYYLIELPMIAVGRRVIAAWFGIPRTPVGV